LRRRGKARKLEGEEGRKEERKEGSKTALPAS
jgi:hypothetical protein